MSSLRIFAGPRALATLRADGFAADNFSWLAGASGGPKWFVLHGLDRYLASSFFHDRQAPLHMIGSSAGAWRLACFAQRDPVPAMDRLAKLYSQQTYSDNPDAHEISREARAMLAAMMGEHGAGDIAGNQMMRLHVIADRARGMLRSDRRLPLSLGLAASAAGNMISRRGLSWFFERHVFHNALDSAQTLPLTDLPSRYVTLTPENVPDALMASGSIPFVMESVHDIAGTRAGSVFRDGGITDYHLDLPFQQAKGLVLYPHFYASITPGWFDRFVPWRTAHAGYFDNAVLLAPSREFVDSLPYGKIPDRNDFKRLDTAERLRYWQIVLQESERLADDFQALVETGTGLETIQAFQSQRIKHV
ncbi:patatin-like phospholipase family protein [Pseudohongiella sp.]|uniref:PNPLA domain-containing protein n=1 Tax=marine sediment metagenome TaxID=412755 RepID=A0A0F9YJN4_9ZZZZ|nr:patatin-like phospholipase family protein [Pseudohongiella sp.]HDZ07638.1 patatin-like phospholipase family protein [Pseudohongiella sp.]HEA63218.1 patatin-like phospholipase family protein [Pseudohongiella sp.]